MDALQQTQLVTIIALVLFSLLMIGIGIYSWRKTQTIDGFLLGGRNIGAWVSAFAYGTSYFSAVIFIGYAGKHGWSIGFASMWIGVGNAVLGCLLAWLLLARRTRTMTHALSVKTMPEFFEARYASMPMKVFAALVIFIFLVPYSAAVYKGLGTMFNTIFPTVSVTVCMAIIAVLTAIYLVLGGYVATAYTDFVQGLIMIFGVFAMVVAIVKNPAVGGFFEGFRRIEAIDPQLVNPWGGSNFKFLCTNILLTSFGTWGLPQMVSKFYAIKDGKSVKTATVVSTGFALIIGCGAYFIGSLARLILTAADNVPMTAAGGVDFDAVIPTMLVTALGDVNLFTTIILAVILLLLLSASMSTLASVVLTSASAISVDLIPVVKKDYHPKHQMGLTRGLCLLFVVLSFLFATMNISIIVNIMSFSWGVVSGCFIGPYIWGIYSKRITKAGAWSGMICGLLAVGIPTAVISIIDGFPAAAALAPEMGVFAMALSIIVTPVVSAFTKKFDKKHLETVFKA
ncbi:MAG TPA: sodium:solute symporter [Candidatus Avimonoglobus intestinipullorum]|uniref:Sodium:solute symporter n=1 Tax=Candidatus Avimonoglobus intestinipullorum TaxID=2840699 RepID=A0A9D1LUG4_9FIRM|nr:sodium:solute symporter [Candidatus Avimonoglobus intestinipullorum]